MGYERDDMISDIEVNSEYTRETSIVLYIYISGDIINR